MRGPVSKNGEDMLLDGWWRSFARKLVRGVSSGGSFFFPRIRCEVCACIVGERARFVSTSYPHVVRPAREAEPRREAGPLPTPPRPRVESPAPSRLERSASISTASSKRSSNAPLLPSPFLP